MIHFTIPLIPISKKNHQQIFINKSNGKPFMKYNHLKNEDDFAINHKMKFGSSRNLIRPEPDITVLDTANWKDNPPEEEIEGYELDTSEPVENGYIENPINGGFYRMQSYRLIRKRE